ncbi:MAG TPA: cysteine dioxygenase family protein, partial [Candidatus Obscuribacterales bacterium]
RCIRRRHWPNKKGFLPVSHYGFDHFAAELEYLVPHSLHQQDLVKKLVTPMQKLLSNEELLPGDFVSSLVDGHIDGRVYTSPEHSFFVQVFAWAPGSTTPIHDHKTWGLMGVYHNQLQITEFTIVPTPEPGVFSLHQKDRFQAGRGMIASVTCPDDEIHHVENPSEHYSYSIHVYGAELDQTDYFDIESGRFYRP